MSNDIGSATICSIALFILSHYTFSLPVDNCEAINENPGIRLGIVVSPLMSDRMIRELGIYWRIRELHGNEQIVLYDGEPEVVGTRAIYAFRPESARGFRRTGIQGEFYSTKNLTFRESCLKHHVAWINNGTIEKTMCLSTHPNWMNEKRSILGSRRLNEIFIPGTHDSGSYYKNENAKMETLVDKYIITQDEDVLSQLIYGVRYLDIRIGRYPGVEEYWWINHGFFSVHPLRLIIDDVKTFLDNTQEIVIFDIQEFPVGFIGHGIKPHEELVAYLEENFHGYYLMKNNTRGWGMSLDDIWNSGKRLIIGYDHIQTWLSHESTWSPVTHRWPNVKTLVELYTKIKNFENGNDPVENVELYNRSPSSVMAELTPDAVDVFLDFLGGLRKMAVRVNMNITDSYNDAWRHNGNIVSMDYIKSSGIIETALNINDEKFSNCKMTRNRS